MCCRMWTVGILAVWACGLSFWFGRHFALQGGSSTEKKETGAMSRDEGTRSESGLTGMPTCSLTPDQLHAQRDQLIPGLFRRAEKTEEIANGIRFHFVHKPKLVSELATLIETERVCCSFLSFRLITEKGEGPIILEVTGPPGIAEMLRKL